MMVVALGAVMMVATSGIQATDVDPRLAPLAFLEGRWVGTGPDGKEFYERYDFATPISFRSQRFPDASFATASDGSIVAVEGDAIISRWGAYSWRASEIRDGFAAFVPIEAPSRFSWRRVDADTIEVTQNWTDAAGQPQSYSLTLRRVR